MSWRNVLGANVSHMTPDQASASLWRIQLRIGVAEQPEVARLTGLAPSRITPFVVAQVCARLAAHARRTRVAVIRSFDPTEQEP